MLQKAVTYIFIPVVCVFGFRGSVWAQSNTDTVRVRRQHRTKTVEILHRHIGKRQQLLPIDQVKQENLDRSSGSTLAETLKDIAGVNLLQTGPAIGKPVIRGMSNNRVAIINNGIRLESQQWGNEHAPEINPADAKEIEVIKGAAAIEYGSEAIGGAVILKSPEMPDTGKPKITFYSGFASNGRLANTGAQAQQSFSYAEKTHGYRISANLRRAGNFNTPQYYLANTGFSEAAASAYYLFKNRKLEFQAGNSLFMNKIGILQWSHIGNLTDLNILLNNPDSVYAGGFSYNIQRPFQEVLHLTSTVTGKYIIGENLLRFQFARQENIRQEYDSHRPLGSTLPPNAPELSFSLYSYQLQLSYESTGILGGESKTGLQFLNQSNITEGRILIPNFKANHISAFYTEDIKHKKLPLHYGLRLENRSNRAYILEFGNRDDPKFSFTNVAAVVGTHHDFSENSVLKLNLSYTERSPNINELLSDGLHHGTASYEEGNRNLKNENSTALNLSYLYETVNTLLSIDAAANYYGNFIYAEPQFPFTRLTIRGAFPWFKYTQAEVLMFNAELNACRQLNPWVKANLSVTYLFANNLSLNQPLIFMPANRAQLGLDLKPSNASAFTFNISSIWVTQQSRAPKNIDYAETPSAYQLYNASLRYIVPEGKAYAGTVIGIQVNNLLNTTYRDYLNRLRYYAFEPGRNLSIYLKINI